MTVAFANNYPQLRTPVSFGVDSGIIPILDNPNKTSFVKPATFPTKSNVEFDIIDFNYKFNLEIVDINWHLNSSNILFRLKVFEGVFVNLILQGEWKGKNQLEFFLKNVELNLENKSEIPTSNFVALSLWAMLGLSKKCFVTFPNLEFNFNLAFEMPLNKITDLLQEREIAYRLMIIEKVLKLKLPFPNQGVTGDDVENISFCFHAIVDREFNWICKELTFFPMATEEFKNLIPETNTSFNLKFPTANEQRIIFGKQLNLGQLLVEIGQAKVSNYNEAKENLLKLNGRPVEVKIKPLNGLMKYTAINTPFLSMNELSKDIQILIDLESDLTNAVFEKHLNSFSNAFEGLSDEQIEVLTERPTLEEEAFNF